jgi:hypothetical protein
MARFLILWLVCLGLIGRLAAQPAGPSANRAPDTTPVPAPPPLPSRTPVDYFRDLLAMGPAEREKALASRSGASRALLATKLAEFEALPASVREARLQTLQLRWLLLPLLKMPPAQRSSRLGIMSESDRRLIEDRLNQWDQLPEDLQRGVLANENFLKFVIRSQGDTPQPEITSTNLSPTQRAQMAREEARWQVLSEPERARIQTQFERLITLSSKEQERILDKMSEVERRRMEQALRSFERLPKLQRESCLRGFRKFSDLTPEERQEFLSNAERWQSMSPKDRQLWRALVARLHPKPPLPPGLRPKPPPLPPAATARTSSPSIPVATN